MDESRGDYYVFCDGGLYDAKVIDGENHGWFANQGGLDEGTRECVILLLFLWWSSIEEKWTELEQKIDAMFKTVKHTEAGYHQGI